MPKTERKAEPAATQKPPSRLARPEQRAADERFKQVMLLVCLVAILTFIIVPKGALTLTEFAPGDISPHDIKAPRDLLIPDENLTEQKRVEAEQAIANLYDYDPGSGVLIAGQVERILATLRGQGPEVDGARLQAELEAGHGVKAEARAAAALREFALRPDSRTRVELLLERLYAGKVAGNPKLFEADRVRGVVFRSLATQAEAPVGEEAVVGIGQLQDLLKEALVTSGLPAAQRSALRDLVAPLLRPNVSFNQNETEARRAAAREQVKPVLSQIKKGEMIAREGDRVTPEQIRRLEALHDENNVGSLWRNALGMLLCSLLIFHTVHKFARRNIRKYRPETRDLLFLATTFVLHVLTLKICIFISTALGSAFPYVDQTAYYYLFPFAVGTMLVRIVLNSEIALVFAILASIVTGTLFGNSFAVMVFVFMSGLAGAHWVRHVTERSSLLRAGMRLGLFNFALIFALHLMTTRPVDLQLAWKLCFGLAGGLAAAVMVTGVVPLVESLFRYTTNIKLLELSNMNSPVLRDLMVQAPGTYHHSIIVGNLAEAAAEKIGVNPLMVRVAAYYHDIGKIRKPLYFIENLGGQENRHDKLAPSMSALILMAHVKDGVEMAREHRLGQALADIIRQHHGTSLMKFFYDRAKSKADPEVEQIDERDYRYAGPKPQTREAALIMLADAVEAASRTLTDPTPARIQGMVQKIINNIFIDGQLDECELTLKDIHNIAKSFNLVLGGIFHYRVDYPEPVSKERSPDKNPRSKDEDRDRKPADQAKDKQAAPAKGGTEDLKRLGMS